MGRFLFHVLSVFLWPFSGDEEDFSGEFAGEFQDSFSRQSPPVQIGQSQDLFIEDRIGYDLVREGVVHGQDHGSSGYSSNRYILLMFVIISFIKNHTAYGLLHSMMISYDRDGNFDLENLMVLEAIWLFIQVFGLSHAKDH